MPVARANVSVCVLPDEQSIAVLGGFNGKAFMNTVEIFDISAFLRFSFSIIRFDSQSRDVEVKIYIYS